MHECFGMCGLKCMNYYVSMYVPVCLKRYVLACMCLTICVVPLGTPERTK